MIKNSGYFIFIQKNLSNISIWERFTYFRGYSKTYWTIFEILELEILSRES